jgi:tRNA-Thr(GGU) m(6)t(6)A37 methyltransferase TsaA
MKYLCLAYGAEQDWRALSRAQQDALLAQDDVLRRRGDLVAAVERPTTVQALDGAVSATAGAFAPARVPLAGFGVIEARDLEEAIALVSPTPCVGAKGAVELRPIVDAPPTLAVVGHVESPLTDPAEAPRQGDEGAPDAWLVFRPAVRDALADVRRGDDLLVLTWLDRADRRTLRVHPRGDPARPLTGVFSTRSQDRPNPIGLHRVRVLAVEDELRLHVAGLEAVDRTPILDVKPVLAPGTER